VAALRGQKVGNQDQGLMGAAILGEGEQTTRMRGVRQTFPQPSPEVTETARAIVRANRGSGRRLQIQQTSDFRMPVEQLAKHLAAATIGYEMGISFDAAMRRYVEAQGRLGEMWKVAAQFILDCQAADNSPTPGPAFAASERSDLVELITN
jgi:hypothetical protein